MNSQCEQIEPLLVDYALGELDSLRLESVKEHVDTCSECSEALEEVEQVVAALARCEMAEPSSGTTAAVREAVRDKVFRRRKVGDAVADLAGAFARRPLLAGASAMVAIAAMTLLLVFPGTPPQKEPSGYSVGRGGQVFKTLGDYLVESRKFLDLASVANGGKALSAYSQDDWKQLIGQAMELQESDDLQEYTSLLTDLEGFFRKALSCGGRFGDKELGELREFLDTAMLPERVDQAIQSWR